MSRYRTPEAEARALANLRVGPKAPPGNQLKRTHGGYSRVAAERESEKVGELRQALTEDAPLPSPADDALLSLAARAMARLEDVEAWLSRYGWCDERTGEPKPAVELERRLRVEIADHLDALGMSKRSRAKLGLDVVRSFDLAQALAELPAEEGGG